MTQRIPSLAILLLLYTLWQRPYFLYSDPPLWPLALGGLSLVFLAARIPVWGWAWWGAGALTLLWSLAPGNTLAASLWEALYLAALGAGQWALGVWGLNLVLLLDNLYTSLALQWYGLTQYFSGSHHYVAGAQALVLIPPLAAAFYRPSRWALPAGVLLVLALYAALISGARAVYLPLLLMLPLMAWRLLRKGVRPAQLALGGATVAAMLVVLDVANPTHPAWSALSRKASLEAQASAVTDGGSFDARLKMWAQSLRILRDYPLGSGNGSYPFVFEAYQEDPRAFSRSAHNYFIETLATGGALRLVLLLALLLPALWRGWRGPDWPWAVGAAGLWLSTAFDVTGYYPSFMMLAFLLIGRLSPTPAPAPRWARAGGLMALAALALWWYVPCSAPDCAITRYRAFQPKLAAALESLPAEAQRQLLEEARRLYPKDAWVVRSMLERARTPEERLQLARTLVREFPGANVSYYLAWANAARAAGRALEAEEAIQTARERFPWWNPDRSPRDEDLLSYP